MTRCPYCRKPAVADKARVMELHVPAVDGEAVILRAVSVRLGHCPAPAGCGRRWLLPWVQLDPIETTLQWLPADFDVFRRPATPDRERKVKPFCS